MITHHKTFITVLILAGGLLFSSNAHAAGSTYYIATTGSDANPCTLAQPCLTFSKGVSKLAGGGDILYVRSGTYVNTVNYDSTMASGTSWSNPIVISAYPGERVTVDGFGLYTHNTNDSAQYVITKDFEVTGGQGCPGVINNPGGNNHPADS